MTLRLNRATATMKCLTFVTFVAAQWIVGTGLFPVSKIRLASLGRQRLGTLVATSCWVLLESKEAPNRVNVHGNPSIVKARNLKSSAWLGWFLVRTGRSRAWLRWKTIACSHQGAVSGKMRAGCTPDAMAAIIFPVDQNPSLTE